MKEGRQVIAQLDSANVLEPRLGLKGPGED